MAVPTLARVFPKSDVPGPRTATGPVVLRAAAALTGSVVYGEGAGDPGVNVQGLETIKLEFDWTIGDETSVQLVGQKRGLDSDGVVVWEQFAVMLTPNSSGVSEIVPHAPQFTAAKWGNASDVVHGAFSVDVSGMDQVRFGLAKTGGTAPGSFTLRASGGRLATAV